MYSIPRGEDEFSSLVSPRAAYSESSGARLYQNNSEELFVNYGTVSSNHKVKVHSSKN